MAWDTAYKPEMIPKMLELFKNGASIAAVCASLPCSKDSYYRWKDDTKNKPEFGEAATLGELLSQKWWEEKGKESMFSTEKELKFNGSCWQFVMASRFRDDYGNHDKGADLRDTLIEKLLEKS